MLAVYDAVLSEHNINWATRIGTERVTAKLDRQAKQTAALRQDVGDLEQLVQGVVASDESRTQLRLDALPDGMRDIVLAASASDPQRTWRLVDALTAFEADPRPTVAGWSSMLPSYLQDAPGPVLMAAAEAALSYNADEVGRSLLLDAADAGAPDRQVLIARVALGTGVGQESEGCASWRPPDLPRTAPARSSVQPRRCCAATGQPLERYWTPGSRRTPGTGDASGRRTTV